MKLFLTRYLIFISLSLFFSNGCGVNTPNLSMINDAITHTTFNLPFSTPGIEAVYKAKIEFGDQYFSGLLAIRNHANKKYRVVFLNELGMKFFDFKIESNGLIIQSCFEAFRKKKIIKVFEESFNALFLHHMAHEMDKPMFDPQGEYTVYPVKMDGMGYYYISNNTGRLMSIEKYKRLSKRLIISLDYNENIPSHIAFQFTDKKMRFSLTNIEK